jgi:predicted helicase
MPLGDKADEKVKTIFDIYSLGVVTNRDAWAYNSSRESLTLNMTNMIAVFNKQSKAYQATRKSNDEEIELEDFIDNDPRKTYGYLFFIQLVRITLCQIGFEIMCPTDPSLT